MTHVKCRKRNVFFWSDLHWASLLCVKQSPERSLVLSLLQRPFRAEPLGAIAQSPKVTLGCEMEGQDDGLGVNRLPFVCSVLTACLHVLRSYRLPADRAGQHS